MKILLTGSRGMVGHNIAEHSMSANHEILSPTSKELNLVDYIIDILYNMYPNLTKHMKK